MDKNLQGLTILLPTFNESKNIKPLLEKLSKVLFDLQQKYEILFVDDSNDNTPEVIKFFALKDSRIRFIHRSPENQTGLATAFIEGFNNAKYDQILCMDSDLQHPPEVIAKLLKKDKEENSDFVVASRYISGGSAKGLGGFYRVAVSIFTKKITQIIFPQTRKTSDPGSGFFLFNKKCLENVDLNPKGYKILIELLVRIRPEKVTEVSYEFLARQDEESKSSLKQGIEFFKHLWLLFVSLPESARFLRYGLVGFSGVFVNLLILTISIELFKHSEQTAWGLGVIFLILSNYYLNNIFTFRDRMIVSRLELFKNGVSYYLSSTLAIALNFSVFIFALEILHIHYMFSSLLGIGVAMGLNYYISKYVVWSDMKEKKFFERVAKFYQALKSKQEDYSLELFFLSLMTLLSVLFLIYFKIYDFSLERLIALSLVLFSVLLSVQGVFTIIWMLYAWESPEEVKKHRSPKEFVNPNFSFSALLPALHEETVIFDTIETISKMAYPDSLKELIVICRNDDTETIKEAQRAIKHLGKDNIKLIIFDSLPFNKPHQLNIGLSHAQNDVVVIFDAEDEPHLSLYNIVNTVMLRDGADVIQSGVQLMNYNTKWFSALNVLEYYFWFKSALHLFSKIGSVPLGGNTVFFKKKMLQQIKGWDENCLTEDADVGIRLSLVGAKTQIIYDEKHVTREETPHSTAAFIKQRTRWTQGFMQIKAKKDWKKLPKLRQKLLILYVIGWPKFQALMIFYIPFAIWAAFNIKLHVVFALFTSLPLYLLLLQVVIYNIGLYEFTKDFKLKYSVFSPFVICFSFLPFQALLIISSFRAMIRILVKNENWEKTKHLNVHRNLLKIRKVKEVA